MSMQDFSIKIEEEDIFVYLNYKGRSTYVKICFENNNDEEHLLNMLKETISDTIGDINVDTCLFYWDEALLFEPDIVPLIRTKRGCGQFKLTLKDGINAVDESDSGIDQRCFEDVVVTSAKLRSSFDEEPVSRKLLHSLDPTEPAIRKSIIHHACQFIFKECGAYPSNSQRSALINALMDVFPGLRPQQKFVVKWFQMKVKNYRRKIKAEDDKGGKRKASDVEEKQQKHAQDQIEFLKTCDGDDDINKIKKALKETLLYRIDLSAKDDWNIYSNYKIFSNNLELMVYDFSLRFPRKNPDIVKDLELFIDASSTIFRVESKQCMPEPECLSDIRKLCCIFNYTKTPTGNREPTFTISQMLDDFLQFSTADEDTKVEVKSHPILVAQGPSKKVIDKYFIQIEESFLGLPDDASFYEAFDYLIQSFYVFNMEFPKTLHVFYNFIMLNIYRIEAKSKYDQKKPRIDDLYMKPRDFLHKVQQYLKGSQ